MVSAPGVRGLLWVVLCAVASGCASSRAPERAPHPSLQRVWNDYRELPARRALALAGELRTTRWVSGAAGGLATREEAESAALDECRRQRARRRLVAPCRLLAVGDEVLREP